MEKETKEEIKILVPIEDLKDSMLLDSDQEVISFKHKGYDVSVRICGEVRVEYENTRYESASEMPDELIQKFRDGSAYDDPDVEIIDNNWFEVFIDKDGGWTGYSDVIDLEGDTEEDIISGLKDMVDEFIKDNDVEDTPVIQIFVTPDDLKSSMLMDSGQEIIAFKYKGYDISVVVSGEVRVIYKEDVYKAANQMSEELLAKFHDHSAFDDPDIEIVDNNWFEAILNKDGHWTGESVVLDDFEDVSEEAVTDVLTEIVNGFIEDCEDGTPSQNRIDNAMDMLVEHAKEHQLEGVEFTEDDAESVIALIDEGNTPEEAADIVLDGIRDCLDDGLDQ